MSSQGPVVIDWANARTGPPGLDVAMTALILAQVVTSPEMVTDAVLGSALPDAEAARLPERLTSFLTSFVKSTTTPFASSLDEVDALRRADRYQSETELARLSDAVVLVSALT